MKLSLHEQDILLAYTLGKPREFLYGHPEYHGTKSQIRKFQHLCQRRLDGEPMAYLLGYKEFYGLDFKVNKHVLIPRPDTELLVDKVIEYCKIRKNTSVIADVGTGSGCIAVTLKKYLPTTQVLASDISATALTIAKQNARQHHTAITFFRSNLLQAAPRKYLGKLDIIVSNLPYLTKTEANKKNLAFEPQIALTAGDSAIKLMAQLITQSALYLKPHGVIFLEIGYRQAKSVRKLCHQTFPTATVRIYQDLGGFDRVIECVL